MWRLLIGAVAGILLWATLAPAAWQVAVQDIGDDLYQLIRAWAVELWGRIRARTRRD